MQLVKDYPEEEVETVLSVVRFHLSLCRTRPESQKHNVIDSLIKEHFGAEERALVWCRNDLETLGKIIVALLKQAYGVFIQQDTVTKLKLRASFAEADDFFRVNIDNILPFFGAQK